MPHNLYLHSALVQSRNFGDSTPMKEAIMYAHRLKHCPFPDTRQLFYTHRFCVHFIPVAWAILRNQDATGSLSASGHQCRKHTVCPRSSYSGHNSTIWNSRRTSRYGRIRNIHSSMESKTLTRLAIIPAIIIVWLYAHTV
jgi:hypothetical protein